VTWVEIGLTGENIAYMIFTAVYKPGIEQVQAALADISRSARCCHSNETREPIANLPNSAQLGAPPTIAPTYILVRAVVWECIKGQTDRHTDGCNQCTSCLGYASCEM